jgi:hypothetical protein
MILIIYVFIQASHILLQILHVLKLPYITNTRIIPLYDYFIPVDEITYEYSKWNNEHNAYMSGK